MSSNRCEACGYFGQVHYQTEEGIGPLICFQCFNKVLLDRNGNGKMWADTVGKGKGEGGPIDNRFLSLKPNQTVKIHVLLDKGEEPYSYWGHFIKKEKGGRSVVCPGRDTCPACKDTRIKAKRTHAINIYDYESKSVKILEKGNSVMQQLKLIYDQFGTFDCVDITLRRIGEGLNTQYIAMAMQLITPFAIQTTKFNLQEIRKPNTPQEIQAIIDGTAPDPATEFEPQTFDRENPGIGNVDTTIPGPNVILSFGKYKGLSMDEVAKQDMNYVKWCADNIADQRIKAEAQRVIGVQPQTASQIQNAAANNKSELITKVFDVINNDPRYKGNIPAVMERMKLATASATTPNGKMLLADYSEPELIKLLEIIK